MRPTSIALMLLLVAAAQAAATEPQQPNIPPANDSRVPAGLREAYRRDAAVLAVRYLKESGDPRRREILLPEALVTSLYRALIHVYNATDLPARNSAVRDYTIHTRGQAALFELLVGVDPAEPWVAGLRRGAPRTENDTVDLLMRTFGLHLDRYRDWSGNTHLAVLRSQEPLNLAPLGERFAAIRGVRYAQPEGEVGDGNNLAAHAEDDGWRLAYSVGWGDCPAGCTGRHTWRFRITTNGHVTYLGSEGLPPPPPPRQPR